MRSLIILASVFAFAGCYIIDCTEGSGAFITKTFEQGNFDSFTLSSSADVELIPSTKNAVEITTYENLMEKVQIENKGGELDIDMANGCIKSDKTMKVKVYFTTLSKVDLTGSGNIISNDTIRSDKFEISITGSGDIKIYTVSSTLETNILGSGDISLRGSTNQFRGKINGSGDILATDLRAANTDIMINGSGDANLGTCTNLTSKVNGSGNVNCKGN